MNLQGLRVEADVWPHAQGRAATSMEHVSSTIPWRSVPWRSRVFLIALWLDIFAIVFREFTASNTIANIGSYGMTFLEVILATSLIAVIANIRRMFVTSAKLYFWIVGILTGILIFNFLRGLFIDPFAAFIALRSVGPLMTYMLLAIIAMRSSGVPERLRSMLIVGSVVLAALALFRRSTGLLQTTWTLTDGRPIGSWGGLLLAVGCILIFSQGFRRKGRSWLHLALIFLLTYTGMIATGQGTANVAALTGMWIVFLLEPGRLRLLRLGSGVLVALLVVTTLAFEPKAASPDALLGMVSGKDMGQYIADREQTSQTRHLIWEGIWKDFPRWSATDQLLGLPTGVKPYIFVAQWGGVEWTNAAHSMYMQTLINQGLIGFWLYIALVILMLSYAVIRALLYRANERANSAISIAAGCGILVAVAVFSYSYDLGGEMAPLLMTGFACTIGATFASGYSRGAPKAATAVLADAGSAQV